MADDPRSSLLALIHAGWTTHVVRTACELRLPDHLADGAMTVSALAAASSCDAAALRRLLSALVTLDLCRNCSDDRFDLTTTGALLQEEHPESLRAWALQVGGPQMQRWAELAESVRSGRGWRERHDGQPGFEVLAQQPAQAAEFHRAMNELTRRVATDVLAAIDLSGARHVVDVGGGSGELLAAVLVACRNARGVLFDQPHGVDHGPALMQRTGVADRCTFIAGSFFDTVPAGGDVYLLKSVLHNWDDPRCVALLRRCRDAMPPSARLLVIERLMAAQPGHSNADRDVARSDINMLANLSGRERTLDEFRDLLVAAGLRLEGVTATHGPMSVIEACVS